MYTIVKFDITLESIFMLKCQILALTHKFDIISEILLDSVYKTQLMCMFLFKLINNNHDNVLKKVQC